MKNPKKRNRKQFEEGQQQQQEQTTLDRYGFSSNSIELNKRMKKEAIFDFENTLKRLVDFQTLQIQERNQSIEEYQLSKQNQHQTLEQRRKKFQDEKMKDNKLFQLFKLQFPEILKFSNIQIKTLFAKRQFMNLQKKIEIVELRFGHYGSIENQQFSYSKIAKQVGAKVSTVVSVVRTYKKRDGKLQIKQGGGGGRKSLLSEEIQKNICQTEQLQKWAHLSLEKRCDLIYTEYQIKISRFTLSKIYKDNRVGYLKTHKSFHSATKEDELTKQRLLFISQIAKYLNENKEIVYMDETSTNVWEAKYKTWQPTDSILPMVHTLPKKRGSNVTIIGAITNKSNRIYFKISDKTNTLNVMEFFKYLNQEINLRNKIIIMDNHPAHHSKVVNAYIENHGGKILFMPPISSYFNPIETIWSWLKGKWRNELIELNGAQPSVRFMSQTLKKLCEQAPPLIVTNIAGSVINYMKKYFKEFNAKQQNGLVMLQ